MTTQYPTAIDSFPTPGANLSSNPHSSFHINADDAITALETKVGIDSSAVTTTIDYKLTNTASVDPGHKHTTASITGLASFPSVIPPGGIIQYGASTAPTGFLLCDGSAVARGTYSTLFGILSTTYGVGDGSTTFNLPDLRSRLPIGYGQTTFPSAFPAASVNTGTNEITVTSNNSLYTGSAAVLTTTGGAPAGLTAGVTYYMIRSSATVIKVASSLANAIAGVEIDITTQGTGTHTFTITYTNYSLGAVGGEETHALTTAELAAHTHTVPANDSSTSAGFVAAQSTTTANGTVPSNSTGGSTVHNNMNPYLVINYIIKT